MEDILIPRANSDVMLHSRLKNPLLENSRPQIQKGRRYATVFSVADLEEIQQVFNEQQDDFIAYKFFKNKLREKKMQQLESLGYAVAAKKEEKSKKKKKKSKKGKKQQVLDTKVSMILNNVENMEKFIKKFCKEKRIEVDEDLIELAEQIQVEAEQFLQESLEQDIKKAEEDNKRAMEMFIKGQPVQPEQNSLLSCTQNLSSIQEMSGDESSRDEESTINDSIQEKQAYSFQCEDTSNDFNSILSMLQVEASPTKNFLQTYQEEKKKQEECESPKSVSDDDAEDSFMTMRKVYRSSSQFKPSDSPGNERRFCRLMTLQKNKTSNLKEFLTQKSIKKQRKPIVKLKSFAARQQSLKELSSNFGTLQRSEKILQQIQESEKEDDPNEFNLQEQVTTQGLQQKFEIASDNYGSDQNLETEESDEDDATAMGENNN